MRGARIGIITDFILSISSDINCKANTYLGFGFKCEAQKTQPIAIVWSSMHHLGVLPEELLFEILSWLPVKDLMRLRCVCKSWNTQVFHPTLVKLHLQKSSKNSDVLLFLPDYFISPCSIDCLLNDPSSTINASHQFEHDCVMSVCNGLVCISNYSYVDEDSYDFGEFYFKFWNPATRFETQDLAHITLDFTTTSFVFGFGYDDWSDTYKLLMLIVDKKSLTMEVRVHSLVYTNANTCWKTISTYPTSFRIYDDGCFVSGTANWLAHHGSCCHWETISINEIVILSYDLKRDTLKYLSMPDGLVEKPVYHPTLVVLKGCLCLCLCGRTHFSAWLMGEIEVDSSWTQLLNVSYENLQFPLSFRDQLPPSPVILCISESEDVMLLADEGRCKITRYNKRDNAFHVFRYGNDTIYIPSFIAHDYVQSLAWLYQN